MTNENYIVISRDKAIDQYGTYYNVQYEANYEGFQAVVITENLGQVKLQAENIFKSLDQAILYCQKKSRDDFNMMYHYHTEELSKYSKIDYFVAELNLFNKRKNQKIKWHEDILKKSEQQNHDIQKGHITIQYIEDEVKIFDSKLKEYDTILFFDLRNKPVIKYYRSFVESLNIHVNENRIDIHTHIFNNLDIQQKFINFEIKDGIYQYNNEDVYIFDNKEIAHDFIISKLIEYKVTYKNEPELVNRQIHLMGDFFR